MLLFLSIKVFQGRKFLVHIFHFFFFHLNEKLLPLSYFVINVNQLISAREKYLQNIKYSRVTRHL